MDFKTYAILRGKLCSVSHTKFAIQKRNDKTGILYQTIFELGWKMGNACEV